MDSDVRQQVEQGSFLVSSSENDDPEYSWYQKWESNPEADSISGIDAFQVNAESPEHNERAYCCECRHQHLNHSNNTRTNSDAALHQKFLRHLRSKINLETEYQK